MRKDKKDFKFDRRAKKYDNGVEGKISKRFYNLLLGQIELHEGMVILDAGCGTGTILRKLGDSCPIDGYGIDTEEKMIIEAQKKCPEMNIQICKCDATPFASQSFDVIIACMAYHHFSDRKGFAKEAARLLKSSGYIYIADPHFPFVIRKILNGIFRLFRINAFLGKAEEIYKVFEEFGFILENVKIDKYAQVIKIKNK